MRWGGVRVVDGGGRGGRGRRCACTRLGINVDKGREGGGSDRSRTRPLIGTKAVEGREEGAGEGRGGGLLLALEGDWS